MSYVWFFLGGISLYGGISMLINNSSDVAIGFSSIWLCLGCYLVYLGTTDTLE